MPFNEVVTDYDDSGYPVLATRTATVTWNTTAGLAAPAAPAPTTATTTGTIPAGVFGVEVTYVNGAGETIASASGSVTTTEGTSGSGTNTITVPSPPASGNATGWYAYVTQLGGSAYTRQQAAGSPTAIGTGLTLTATPTSTGAAPPALNATGGIIRAAAGRLARAVVTTALAGSGSTLALYDGAAGQPSGTPLLVIPVATGAAGAVFPVDVPVTAGITALGSQLTAGAVTLGYS